MNKPEFCHWCEEQFPTEQLHWAESTEDDVQYPCCKPCFMRFHNSEEGWVQLDPVEPTPETDMNTYEFVIVQIVQETRTVRIKAHNIHDARLLVSDGVWDEDDGVDEAELHAHNDNTILSEREVKQ